MSAFPRRPWAWEPGGQLAGEMFTYDPQALARADAAALAYFARNLPDCPLAFLDDCAAWWAWVEAAEPEAIERAPLGGHLPARKPEFPAPRLLGEDGSETVTMLGRGLMRIQRGRNVYYRAVPTTPKPPIEPRGQGRPNRKPNPPPRDP